MARIEESRHGVEHLHPHSPTQTHTHTPSLPWKPMARWEMAQLTRYATWASSLRDSMRTAMMGGRVSWVMMAGSMSWACRNSKMRPMVQAVVSLTEGWGSCKLAWAAKWEGCFYANCTIDGHPLTQHMYHSNAPALHLPSLRPSHSTISQKKNCRKKKTAVPAVAALFK
eukprot:1161299-Pelagomonas_calceolata.AAC.8